MCVSACMCVWWMGEGCLHNSEQWECTVVPPSRLWFNPSSPCINMQGYMHRQNTPLCMQVVSGQYGYVHMSEKQSSSFV